MSDYADGVGSFEVLDTHPSVQNEMVESWRAMTPSDRLAVVADLNDSCERMAEAGVRLRHPSAGPDEIRLRLIALRLGRDLMVQAYGWDPDIEGW